MKTSLINFLTAGLLLVGITPLSGSDDDPVLLKTHLENVRTQIIEMIDEPDLSRTEFKEAEAFLHFMINKANELVVVYVDTNEEFVESYLKQKLNYQKIQNNLLRGPYSMKIKFRNGSL